MKTAQLLLVALLWVPVTYGQPQVWTYHNDNLRTGQNANEVTLTTSNVQPGTFGKLFSQPVDDAVYAQPLYLSSVSIPGLGVHNVVFVATEADSVYAFDADNNVGPNAQPLWKVSLLDAAHGAATGATTVPAEGQPQGVGVMDWTIGPEIGITSTPVIDSQSGTLFVVAYSYENGGYVYRLHALDVTTGSDKAETCIAGTVSANDCPALTSQGATFNAFDQLNRPALLLSGGSVYVGFGSHSDNDPLTSYGWVTSYNETTLALEGVFVTTPSNCPSDEGCLGSIWMSGAGLDADADGNIYAATGNGPFGGADFGDSIIKLSGSDLSLVDSFTPFNQSELDMGDVDVGSGGVLLLPDQAGPYPHLLIQAGKEGTIYSINRDQMGGYCSGCGSDSQLDPQSPLYVGGQEIRGIIGPPNTAGTGMRGLPTYWNNTVYFWGSGSTPIPPNVPNDPPNPPYFLEKLKAFSLVNGSLAITPTTSPYAYPYPGSNTSVSANGLINGIIWSIETGPVSGDCALPLGPPILEAYDALNISTRLYSSSNLSDNANMDHATKFAVPTVVNGKVYVAAGNAGENGQLTVYGLNPQPHVAYAAPWVSIGAVLGMN